MLPCLACGLLLWMRTERGAIMTPCWFIAKNEKARAGEDCSGQISFGYRS